MSDAPDTKHHRVSTARKRRWPVTLWFANCPGTERKAGKKDVADLIASGLFPELEEEFPELAKKLEPK